MIEKFFSDYMFSQNQTTIKSGQNIDQQISKFLFEAIREILRKPGLKEAES